MGAQVRWSSGAHGGAALVYRGSPDFTHWELEGNLLAAAGSPMCAHLTDNIINDACACPSSWGRSHGYYIAAAGIK